MRIFNTFEDAFGWVGKVVKKSSPLYMEAIAEQVYKDSDKYTFRETGAMYDSGALFSDFKKGYVIEKAPQVRHLYYATKSNAGDGNRNAIPQWFEQTKKENMDTYIKMYKKIIDQQKG